MDVHVRRAEKSDAPAIAEMAMKLVEQHVGYDPVRFALIATLDGMQWFYGGQTEAANAAVLVAETDTAAVGFAYMQFEPIIYEALAVKTVWLHDIYVGGSKDSVIVDAYLRSKSARTRGRGCSRRTDPRTRASP